MGRDPQSRYWRADSYEQKFAAGAEPDSLDKEFLRLWIAGKCDPYKDPIPEIPADTLIAFSDKYVSLYEQLTGLEFDRTDPAVPVRDRIRAALVSELPEYFK